MKSLHVSIPEQKVHLYANRSLQETFPVSTSRFGIGSIEGSNCTPLGRFRICEKYGTRAPEGTIFKGRKPIGLWSPESDPGGDLVLTRILRLESDEPETQNTYQRYLYFHGTNHENCIGSPASHGCVILTNADIVRLYSLVPVGTEVFITNTFFP